MQTEWFDKSFEMQIHDINKYRLCICLSPIQTISYWISDNHSSSLNKIIIIILQQLIWKRNSVKQTFIFLFAKHEYHIKKIEIGDDRT